MGGCCGGFIAIWLTIENERMLCEFVFVTFFFSFCFVLFFFFLEEKKNCSSVGKMKNENERKFWLFVWSGNCGGSGWGPEAVTASLQRSFNGRSSQQPHEIFQKTNPQLNPSVMSAEIYPISWGAIFFLIFMGIINYNLYFFFLSGDFYSLFLFLLLILFSFSYLPRQRFKIL